MTINCPFCKRDFYASHDPRTDERTEAHCPCCRRWLYVTSSAGTGRESVRVEQAENAEHEPPRERKP